MCTWLHFNILYFNGSYKWKSQIDNFNVINI